MDVFEGLEQYSSIAGILDVQVRRLNDIIEKRLHLSIAQMACRPAQTFSGFFEKFAYVLSCDGCNLIVGKPHSKMCHKFFVALQGAFSERVLLMLLKELNGFFNNHFDTSIWVGAPGSAYPYFMVQLPKLGFL